MYFLIRYETVWKSLDATVTKLSANRVHPDRRERVVSAIERDVLRLKNDTSVISN